MSFVFLKSNCRLNETKNRLKVPGDTASDGTVQ